MESTLAPIAPLAQPLSWVITEITKHRSAFQLTLDLELRKALIIVQFAFVLLGLWGVVVFWTITVRGDACRKRAHSEWRARFMPTAETLQVLVLSCFLQLILSASLHLGLKHLGSFGFATLLGVGIGVIGAVFMALLNAWIRGESISLRKALDVRNVDKAPIEWMIEGDDKEYGLLYEAGGDRTLGNLANHDWESMHRDFEQEAGLIDLSENVFDEVQPEKDPNLLAAFLNSSLLSAFGGKKKADHQEKKPPAPQELQVISVEVPGGIKTPLRDALMQWRMRHTAHPRELDAVDWLLGQLDPGFELLAVKVPEQARLLILAAVLEFSQKHANLDLDMCHASRVQATLQQLAPSRFHGLEVQLPDDGSNTEKVRELIHAALEKRITEKSSRDITQEEGALLLQVMNTVGHSQPLITMPYEADALVDEQLHSLKAELDARADVVRETSTEYLYDDDIFEKVPVILRERPPDIVEELKQQRKGKGARQGKQKVSKIANTIRAGNRDANIAAPAAAIPTTVPPASPAPADPRLSPVMPDAVEPTFSPPPSPPDGLARASSTQPSLASSQRSSKSVFGDEDLRGALRTKTRRGAVSASSLAPVKKRAGLRHWWRLRRKREKADHDQMPCWKQYVTLFVGSVMVGICTIAMVTLSSIIPPLTYIFVITSFGISLPLSITLHFSTRSFIRYARKQLALRDARLVEGDLAKAKKRYAKSAGKKNALPGDASGSAASLEDRTKYFREHQRESGFLDSKALNAAPSLATRMYAAEHGVSLRNLTSACGAAPAAEGAAPSRPCTGVMTRVSSTGVGQPRLSLGGDATTEGVVKKTAQERTEEAKARGKARQSRPPLRRKSIVDEKKRDEFAAGLQEGSLAAGRALEAGDAALNRATQILASRERNVRPPTGPGAGGVTNRDGGATCRAIEEEDETRNTPRERRTSQII